MSCDVDEVTERLENELCYPLLDKDVQKLPDIPQTLFGFMFPWNNACTASLVLVSSSDEKQSKKNDNNIIRLRWATGNALAGRIRPEGRNLSSSALDLRKKNQTQNFINFFVLYGYMIWNGYHNTGLNKLFAAVSSYRKSTRRYRVAQKDTYFGECRRNQMTFVNVSFMAGSPGEAREGLENEL